jgi:hypothetical protein
VLNSSAAALHTIPARARCLAGGGGTGHRTRGTLCGGGGFAPPSPSAPRAPRVVRTAVLASPFRPSFCAAPTPCIRHVLTSLLHCDPMLARADGCCPLQFAGCRRCATATASGVGVGNGDPDLLGALVLQQARQRSCDHRRRRAACRELEPAGVERCVGRERVAHATCAYESRL